MSYSSVDVAWGLVLDIGAGAVMAKSDIKSAFHLFPVHPTD